MMLFILIPLFTFYSIVLGVVTSVLATRYLYPILEIQGEMSIPEGILWVICVTLLYFIIFSKNLESKKFKRFLGK